MTKLLLTERQEKLFAFVAKCHGDQKRKYTGAPYTDHLLAVAEMVARFHPSQLLVEIALCHDLFEDTECNNLDLFDFLLNNDYYPDETDFIVTGVEELTDYFTKDRFPKMNRKERKMREADRLGKISHSSQTVKYADLIDNTSTIAYLDPGFAKTYLREKLEILDHMREGHIGLLIQVCASYQKAMDHLDGVLKPGTH